MRRSVGDLDVHVWLGRVARVAALRQHLAGYDLVADADPNRPAPQMDQRHKRLAVAQADDDVVAGDRLDAGPDTCGLTEGVRNQRELRTPPFVVALAVARPHDDTVPGREDRPPVPDVALDRLGGEQRPPVPTAGGSVAVVTPTKSMA